MTEVKTYLFDGIAPSVYAVLEKVAKRSVRKGLRAVVVTSGSVVRDHLVKSYRGDRFDRFQAWVMSNPLKDLERKYYGSFPIDVGKQEDSRKKLGELYAERERIRARLEEIKEEVYEASRNVVLTHGMEGVFLDVNGRTELYHPSYSVSKKRRDAMIYYNRANYAEPIDEGKE